MYSRKLAESINKFFNYVTEILSFKERRLLRCGIAEIKRIAARHNLTYVVKNAIDSIMYDEDFYRLLKNTRTKRICFETFLKKSNKVNNSNGKRYL